MVYQTQIFISEGKLEVNFNPSNKRIIRITAILENYICFSESKCTQVPELIFLKQLKSLANHRTAILLNEVYQAIV